MHDDAAIKVAPRWDLASLAPVDGLPAAST
jgi:hypothetical protein